MSVRTPARLYALAAMLACLAPAAACAGPSVEAINRRLCGTLLDFTNNGGCDRRVYSAALCTCRDLYLYLPPGYDPNGSYPLLVWMHGYMHDEREFARDVVPIIDRAIVCEQLAPLIVVAPDGSLKGRSGWMPFGSWYVNSERGRFADFIIQDVVGFVEENFAVSRDRACRALAGFSMGGFGAYSLGLQNPDRFKLIAGISPALNLRYVAASGQYAAEFNPGAWLLRDDYRGREVVGRFYGGLLSIRAWQVVRPVWGKGPAAIQRVSESNPIELLDRLDVPNGRQDFYIGYGKADELNVDAQVESFLDVAGRRGIEVETRRYPCGRHDIPFMLDALPDLLAWLNRHLPRPARSPVSN